ncbi:ABC transporter permease subunit [Paenibacillus doosanensis]|uniref:Nickel import system permease protein NikB n=1 Tax=Paenibacillus konkukensis TaxID=2020716 RepID=A0ABY4RF49_9BACL|nr:MULTISPECIES: nickel ABC transporter permease [Paenibacillus]MCS7461312.1 ABC transporter permease subunit [Paenibacillus doosanensis]UQZ81078.1 Nickel transport system permease protein NikB [Paenibacillus konkukensis]
MAWFIVKRVLGIIPILFGVSLITFLIVRLLPVDPAEAYLRLSKIPVTDEAVQLVREELGLNQPLYVQYVHWLSGAVKLDFGSSYISKKPVWDEMLHYLPATLQLTFSSIVLAFVISLPIGILSALYKDRWVDHVSRTLSFIGAAAPSFCLGFLFIYIFSLKLGYFPVSGRGSLLHLILPSLTLALASVAVYTRMLRGSTLNELHQPYVLYARARGLREKWVIGKHVLRNAITPLVTTMGMHIGHKLSGSIIVENVFAWPGIGRHFVNALFGRDYPVILCYVLLVTTIIVICNLLIDIFHAMIDPRVRRNGGQ